jgi:hypothetical protein
MEREYEEFVTSALAEGIATVPKPERCASSQVLSFAADRRGLNDISMEVIGDGTSSGR